MLSSAQVARLLVGALALHGCGARSSLWLGADAGDSDSGQASGAVADAGAEDAAPPPPPPPAPHLPGPCASPDRDFDGYDDVECGGDDCDDHDHGVHPGATDQETGWHEQIADRDEVVCCSTSLALDADGRVHVAYYASRMLRYLRIDEASVHGIRSERQTIVGAGPPGSGYASLALDGTGVAHVAHLHLPGFREADEGELRYSTNEGGEWRTEVVDDEGDTGYDPSIAVTADGALHVSYFDAEGGSLRHAMRGVRDWWLETVDSEGETGLHSSIAVGPDGAIHIAYHDFTRGYLRHAVLEDGIWSTETIDSEARTGRHTSIAIADDGTIHVAYQHHDARALRHAWGGWDDWTIETVDATEESGRSTSVALGPDGLVHVAYTRVLRDGRDEELRHAVQTPEGWAISSFEAGWFGGLYTSIAVDDRGPHITHIDKGWQNLGYFFVGRADGIDQNCDGVDGVDGDGDGFAATWSGGADCDDDEPATHPEADDPAGDGIDQDCDGEDG